MCIQYLDKRQIYGVIEEIYVDSTGKFNGTKNKIKGFPCLHAKFKDGSKHCLGSLMVKKRELTRIHYNKFFRRIEEIYGESRFDITLGH